MSDYGIDEELIRRWRPSKKQEEFIRIPFSIKEALYGGAVFGGKSAVLRMLPLIYRFHENPHFQGVIFRRTYTDLEESHIIKAQQEGFYRAAGGEYNKNNHIWTFKSGAVIRFSYCDEDKDARNHDSAEYQLMCFDEITHFTEWQYRYLLSRVRSGASSLPAIIRSGGMPGNRGHAWVRERFIDPAPSGFSVIKDNFTKTKRLFIPARLEDNEAGIKADPTYANLLNNLPEAERKAKREGDWYVFSGQVFTEFRDQPIPGEPPNACHVIEPFKIPDWWPKLISIDWGYIHPTHVTWAALSPDKRIYIYREYGCEKTKISDWAADIRRLSQGEDFVATIIDPSANADRGQPQTIAQQVSEITGWYLESADNDRISGKMLFHDYMRWSPRRKTYTPAGGFDGETYERIFRMRGDKAAADYAELFKPEPDETNLPILQIFNTCPKLIETIKICTYEEKHKDSPLVKAEDVAKFVGDDAYDSCRYILKACEAFWDGLDKENKKYEDWGRILAIKDQTSFYQAAEMHEKKYKQGIQPVSLHRQRRFH